MHVYEYRHLVVPNSHWNPVLLPWAQSYHLNLAHGYWMYGTNFMVTGYTMGNVFRHVYDHHANIAKQKALQELKPAAYAFFVQYFRKKCKENLILPVELCRIIASFLF